jgi:alkyl hydroperoxide reductase subunit D
MMPNPITVNGNWIESVRDSIPEHAEDIKTNLLWVMENHGLEKVDAHACAYSAAIAANNGGLAFEIEMNSPLFMHEAEREATKAAAALMGMNNTWFPFVEVCKIELINPQDTFTYSHNMHGVSTKKFLMYSLAASIVGKCNGSIKTQYDALLVEGLTVEQLRSIGKIAAIVNSIGKIAI